ncbi:hypothetical protein ARMGADRAFT_1038718 [Armillaria gallica]|uniref:Uncharacterized protein n=1 Tax=Armillaria gallica TaxID=47427 RepID=A0A2H3D268_ARMGA|nr:hypothetical protein ARMGADRAFT_1038718 [Armillaria gallica]
MALHITANSFIRAQSTASNHRYECTMHTSHRNIEPRIFRKAEWQVHSQTGSKDLAENDLAEHVRNVEEVKAAEEIPESRTAHSAAVTVEQSKPEAKKSAVEGVSEIKESHMPSYVAIPQA